MIVRSILSAAIALAATFLAGCGGMGTAPLAPLQPAQRHVEQGARHPKAILYVLVNAGTYDSYVALYDAYAENPQLLGTITQGLPNPGAIWSDAQGNLYVGNDMTYTSSVVEYAPGATKPTRTYTNGIDLPFGGTVGLAHTMYVSVAGIRGRIEGGIAVFRRGRSKPSTFLVDNIYVPHGVAEDQGGNLFVAQIYGLQSSVVEFPSGSSQSTVLPLNDLNSGAFLEDLKLDANGDIVVADANLNAVRFYPPPYENEREALTSGLSAPTALAYGPDGSLFVGNEYVNVNNGNVVVFRPGAKKPARTISDGITGGVLGVAIGPGN
jgi:hypothetical protein